MMLTFRLGKKSSVFDLTHPLSILYPINQLLSKARDIPDGISLIFYVKGRYDAIRAKPVIFRRDIQHFVFMIKTIYPPIDNIPP